MLPSCQIGEEICDYYDSMVREYNCNRPPRTPQIFGIDDDRDSDYDYS